MRILETHADGSRTLLYESGDRVFFPADANGGGFLGAKAGQKATVIRRKQSEERFQSIAFLEVQTDEMKAGGWGVITVAPWDIEPLEESNS
jgi:hypothetical protein